MTSRHLLVAATLLFPTAVAACGDADARSDAAAEPVVRDSAGVTIVENTDPLWTDGEAWRLSEEPALEIGMLDGPDEYQFGRVSDVVRLSDGTVTVVNSGTNELRFYDDAGRYRSASGRTGAGPGEFESLQGV